MRGALDKIIRINGDLAGSCKGTWRCQKRFSPMTARRAFGFAEVAILNITWWSSIWLLGVSRYSCRKAVVEVIFRFNEGSGGIDSAYSLQGGLIVGEGPIITNT